MRIVNHNMGIKLFGDKGKMSDTYTPEMGQRYIIPYKDRIATYLLMRRFSDLFRRKRTYVPK